MGDKEEKSLLPTSSSVRNVELKERRYPLLKRAFFSLHVFTITIFVCWLTLLTLKTWSSDAKTMLTEELIRQLKTSQEVRYPKFSPAYKFLPSGSWKEAAGQWVDDHRRRHYCSQQHPRRPDCPWRPPRWSQPSLADWRGWIQAELQNVTDITDISV